MFLTGSNNITTARDTTQPETISERSQGLGRSRRAAFIPRSAKPSNSGASPQAAHTAVSINAGRKNTSTSCTL